MTRTTGPRVTRSPGPRVATPQPGTPPTTVQLGQDRVLARAREVSIDQVHPDPDQPRKEMQPERLRELAASIAGYGVLQPLIVRQDGMARNGDMSYTIIAGGRRYAAIQLALREATDGELRARLARVPVVITDTPEAQHRILQLVENLQREDLSPIEEARALRELMALQGWTMERVAASVHRSHGYVDERLRLLRHEDIADAVEAGQLTKSAGAAIASISSTALRAEWLARARRGEVVRPKDIYASKPDRRVRTSHSPQASSPRRTPDRDPNPEPGPATAGGDLQGTAQVPSSAQGAQPTDFPVEPRHSADSITTLPEVYMLVQRAAAPEQRLLLTVLHHGAQAGMTCQELLTAIARFGQSLPPLDA